MEGVVVDDQQVGAEQFADLGVEAVVEAGDPESFEELVGSFEPDAVTSADGGVPEGDSEEGFADADRPDDQPVLGGLDEAEAGEFVDDVVVVGDVRGWVPVG